MDKDHVSNILGVWVRELEIQIWKELLVTDFLKWSEFKTSKSKTPWTLRDLKPRPESFDVSSRFSPPAVIKSSRRKAVRPLAAHTATEDKLLVKERVMSWDWNWKGEGYKSASNPNGNFKRELSLHMEWRKCWGGTRISLIFVNHAGPLRIPYLLSWLE